MPKLNLSKTEKNYLSISYHAGVDGGRAFSSLVNNHLSLSRLDNNSLNSAVRSYKKKLIRVKSCLKHRSKSEQQAKTTINSVTKLHQKKQQSNMDIMQIFQAKTEKVSKLQGMFQEKEQRRKKLQFRIFELKQMILDEKKLKDKMSLLIDSQANDKIVIQNKTKNMLEKERKHEIQLKQLSNDCLALKNQIKNIKAMVLSKKSQINYQKLQKEQDKRQVEYLKKALIDEEKQLSKIKEAQGLGFKTMSNDFMHLNQLKEQKAKLLTSIEDDVKNNKICKKFHRIN